MTRRAEGTKGESTVRERLGEEYDCEKEDAEEGGKLLLWHGRWRCDGAGKGASCGTAHALAAALARAYAKAVERAMIFVTIWSTVTPSSIRERKP